MIAYFRAGMRGWYRLSIKPSDSAHAPDCSGPTRQAENLRSDLARGVFGIDYPFDDKNRFRNLKSSTA
ncbi:hypothetical protein C7H84_28820 [Burkholderia sp. Nafp2/4-1b]|nr:hypothetical protein C7H84_28820 [Burkholderia sp. Nafp2/4-1b]